MLFENLTPTVLNLTKQTIFDVIEKFEPRVMVLDVDARETPDDNSIDVDITFQIVNTQTPITVTAAIQRVG